MQRVLTVIGFCVACSLFGADRAWAQACNSSAGNGVTASIDHANVGDMTFWRIDTFAGSAPNNCSFVFEGVTWYPPNQPVPAGTSPCDDITEGIQLPLPPGGPHVLALGQSLTYTGKNPPDFPCPPGGPFVNCEIFASELIYTISQADLIPDPDNALLQVVLGEACSQLTIVGVGEDNSKEASGVIGVTTPEIEIQKEVEPDTICQGEDTEVTYTYEVTIPPGGDVSLVNVVVTDDMCSPVVRGPDILGNNNNVLNFDPISGVAEIWSYSCGPVTLSQTTTNTATATGTDFFTCPTLPCGAAATATDTDTATVTALVCCVDIEKTCDRCDPDTGDSSITITVTNCSGPNIALANCVVTDEIFLGDEVCPGDLGTGTPVGGAGPFDLPSGGSAPIPLIHSGPPLLCPAANNVSVTCDVVDLGVTVDDEDCDECEPCVCDVHVDKQISCDGGATFVDVGFGDNLTDICTGEFDGPITVRYVAENASPPCDANGVDLTDCMLSDSNTEILSVPVAIASIPNTPGGIIHEVTVDCTQDVLDMEPNTATLTCNCELDEEVFDTAQDSDTANFDCVNCPILEVDKRVSCDGGDSFVDVGFGDNVAELCLGWNAFGMNPAENIIVQYWYRSTGGDGIDNLEDCTLTDSNSDLNPDDPGTIAATTVAGGVLLDEIVVPCSETLDNGEPDTATLTCQCPLPGGGSETLTDTDQANFDCQTPTLSVEKDCGQCDPATGGGPITITVSNTGTAALAGCVLTDETCFQDSTCPGAGTCTSIAGGAPFDLPVGGGPVVRNLSYGGLPLECPAANNVSVTCDIVGTVDKTIIDEDCDVCEPCVCDVQVDKQISCDGGATFVDVGFDADDECDPDPSIVGCTGDEGSGIIVRYRAQNNSPPCANVNLTDCMLSDSNTLILPVAVAVGPIPNLPGGTIHQVTVPCNDEVTAMEPDTATLVCNCALGEDVFDSAEDCDSATFECQGGGEGCTPGYWKQCQHFCNWCAALAPPTGAGAKTYNSVFGVTSSFGSSFTLLNAIRQGGGGEKALGRHASAALLNACSAEDANPNNDVAFAFSVQEVKVIVKRAYGMAPPLTFAQAHAMLAAENEAEGGCPLGNCGPGFPPCRGNQR